MSAKLSRKGNIVYVTFESGKRYRLESVLARRRADLAAAEVREREQTKNLWWRLATRSRDVPNSRASRVDISDNGSGAAAIRNIETTYHMWSRSNQQTNQLPTTSNPTTSKPTTNFYNGRMSKAIAFLRRRQRIKYGSPEHRELEQLLWCVFRNRRKFRSYTLAALHLTRTAYLRRLRTYTALLLNQ